MEETTMSEEKQTAQPSIDSKYRRILIAAKRSKQLQRGARPRIQSTSAKHTRIALEEVAQGLVDFEIYRLGEPEE
ncbi:MAG: DNA-directed RNA polymerase subunit omega [Acidobacteria bacterium]|nr:DNA-directed RNA polymerase subunit omega [Acidobacteriota bacterium]